jgi:hypothetical protein
MRWLPALVTGLAISAAHATSFSTDFTDIWWDPANNGEGFNVVHQGDTLFVTFFVYDSANRPIWYVAPATTYSGTSGDSAIFQGALYQTAGPPGPNGAAGAQQVGTLTFAATGISTAILTYTVNTAPFQKSLIRQTWRNDDLSGGYIGASVGTYSGCPANGYAEEASSVSIAQSGTTVTVQAAFSNYSCTYAGTYAQAGRMGSITGAATCTDAPGQLGSFSAFELQVTPAGFMGHASVTFGSCVWAGRFGGLRRVQ